MREPEVPPLPDDDAALLGVEEVLRRLRESMPALLPLAELEGRAAAVRALAGTERQSEAASLRADLRAMLSARQAQGGEEQASALRLRLQDRYHQEKQDLHPEEQAFAQRLRLQEAAEELRADRSLPEAMAAPLGETLRKRFDALCPPSLSLSPARLADLHRRVATLLDAALAACLRESALPALGEAVATRVRERLPEAAEAATCQASELGQYPGWLRSSFSFEVPFAPGAMPAPAYRALMVRKCQIVAQEAAEAASRRLCATLESLHESAEGGGAIDALLQLL